jgi:hypothetical protein
VNEDTIAQGHILDKRVARHYLLQGVAQTASDQLNDSLSCRDSLITLAWAHGA